MSILLYPPYLQWEVVSDCNHKCIHCYNYWRAQDLPVEKCQYFDEITERIIERKPVYVAITGGEPFLVFEQIKPCIERMVKSGIRVSISTNGTLIEKEQLPFIQANNIDLVISLPSIDPEVCDSVCNSCGVVGKLKALFPLLREFGIPVTINVVVSKLNLPTLLETIKGMKDYGFTIRVGIAQRPINASEKYLRYELTRADLHTIMEQCLLAKKNMGVDIDFSVCLPDCAFQTENEFFGLGKGSCFAGTTHYALSANGDIKACQCDSRVYGNILRDSFECVYKKMSMWRDGSLIPQECFSCDRVYSCRGGCRVEAFANTGNYRALPTFADVRNIPVKFNKKQKEQHFLPNSSFFVSTEICFLEDKDCCRLSRGIVAVHVSKEFAIWLQQHSSFSFEMLCADAEIPEENIVPVLGMLIANKMIAVQK